MTPSVQFKMMTPSVQFKMMTPSVQFKMMTPSVQFKMMTPSVQFKMVTPSVPTYPQRSLREQDVSLLRQLIAISEAIQRIQRCRALRVSKSLSFSSSVLYHNQGPVCAWPMRIRNSSFSTRSTHHNISISSILNNNNNNSSSSNNNNNNDNNNTNKPYIHEQYWSCRDVAIHHLGSGSPTTTATVFDGSGYGNGCSGNTTSNGDSDGNTAGSVFNNNNTNTAINDMYPHIFRDSRSLGSLSLLRRQMSTPPSAESRRHNWLYGSGMLSSTDSESRQKIRTHAPSELGASTNTVLTPSFPYH